MIVMSAAWAVFYALGVRLPLGTATSRDQAELYQWINLLLVPLASLLLNYPLKRPLRGTSPRQGGGRGPASVPFTGALPPNRQRRRPPPLLPQRDPVGPLFLGAPAAPGPLPGARATGLRPPAPGGTCQRQLLRPLPPLQYPANPPPGETRNLTVILFSYFDRRGSRQNRRSDQRTRRLLPGTALSPLLSCSKRGVGAAFVICSNCGTENKAAAQVLRRVRDATDRPMPELRDGQPTGRQVLRRLAPRRSADRAS